MELTVVIAIIAGLSAYVVMHIQSSKQRAQGQQCRANIMRIYTAMEGYNQNEMSYIATSANGDLMKDLIANKHYTWLPKVECPSDPEENDYLIVSDPASKAFTICCLGTHERHKIIHAGANGYPQYCSRIGSMDPRN